MSKTKRIFNIIGAIFVIQAALFLMLVPSIAFQLIAVFVGIYLTYNGMKYLIYYLTHAQHMVGGKRIFLVGLIMFDLGVFATTLFDQAQAIMIIYVVAAHLVAAGLSIIRAVGNKRDNNPGWKIDLAQGIGNITLVVLCLVFINHVEIPVFIYSAGLIYSAILTIIQSCKRTAIVYVQ